MASRLAVPTWLSWLLFSPTSFLSLSIRGRDLLEQEQINVVSGIGMRARFGIGATIGLRNASCAVTLRA